MIGHNQTEIIISSHIKYKCWLLRLFQILPQLRKHLIVLILEKTTYIYLWYFLYPVSQVFHLVLVKIIEVSVTVVANNLRIVGHLYIKLVLDEAFDLGFNSRSNLLNFSRLFTILCETNCTCFMQTVRHFVYCFENFRGFLSKISRISDGFQSFW